ncbi:hypothetical protein ACU4GD_45305 [Cupriavidus basilensis]
MRLTLQYTYDDVIKLNNVNVANPGRSGSSPTTTCPSAPTSTLMTTAFSKNAEARTSTPRRSASPMATSSAPARTP